MPHEAAALQLVSEGHELLGHVATSCHPSRKFIAYWTPRWTVFAMCDRCLDGITKSERRSACMECSQMVDAWVTHVRYTSQACLILKKHSCSQFQAFCVVPGCSRYQGSTPQSSSDGQSSLGFKGQHCRTRSTQLHLRRSIIVLIRQLIVGYR